MGKNIFQIILTAMIIKVLLVVITGFIAVLMFNVESNSVIIQYLDVATSGLVIFYLRAKYSISFFENINTRLAVIYSLAGILFSLLIYYSPIYLLNISTISDRFNYVTSLVGVNRFLFLLILILLGPIIEEIVFRGYIFKIVRDNYSFTFATLVSTVLFLVSHGLSIQHLYYVGLQSLVLCFVYERSKTIISCIIVHSCANCIWFIFYIQ